MPVSKKITLHLGKNKVKFDVVEHKKVYTAYDLAQTLGEKLENIAKTLLVEAELPALKKKGKNYFVVVLPASYRVELGKVKKALKASRVALAAEKAMKKLGIQPGALTPFGSLRGLGVIVDKALLKTKSALVGAESFTESLRMKVKDLVKVEHPIVAAIGKRTGLKLQVQTIKRPAKKTGKKSVKKSAKKRR